MSTNRDPNARPSDRIVSLISLWLARHLDDSQLLAALESSDTDGLASDQAEVVRELVEELRTPNGRGELEMVARETLEALALGG
jgi:hypothetical protein